MDESEAAAALEEFNGNFADYGIDRAEIRGIIRSSKGNGAAYCFTNAYIMNSLNLNEREAAEFKFETAESRELKKIETLKKKLARDKMVVHAILSCETYNEVVCLTGVALRTVKRIASRYFCGHTNGVIKNLEDVDWGMFDINRYYVCKKSAKNCHVDVNEYTYDTLDKQIAVNEDTVERAAAANNAHKEGTAAKASVKEAPVKKDIASINTADTISHEEYTINGFTLSKVIDNFSDLDNAFDPDKIPIELIYKYFEDNRARIEKKFPNFFKEIPMTDEYAESIWADKPSANEEKRDMYDIWTDIANKDPNEIWPDTNSSKNKDTSKDETISRIISDAKARYGGYNEQHDIDIERTANNNHIDADWIYDDDADIDYDSTACYSDNVSEEYEMKECSSDDKETDDTDKIVHVDGINFDIVIEDDADDNNAFENKLLDTNNNNEDIYVDEVKHSYGLSFLSYLNVTMDGNMKRVTEITKDMLYHMTDKSLLEQALSGLDYLADQYSYDPELKAAVYDIEHMMRAIENGHFSFNLHGLRSSVPDTHDTYPVMYEPVDSIDTMFDKLSSDFSDCNVKTITDNAENVRKWFKVIIASRGWKECIIDGVTIFRDDLVKAMKRLNINDMCSIINKAGSLKGYKWHKKLYVQDTFIEYRELFYRQCAAKGYM